MQRKRNICNIIHYELFNEKSERSSNFLEWLPDLDSNQDKLNQNQLCYRYTIGQK